MNGWLIKNKYYVSDNFLKLENLIISSAKKLGIKLNVYTNIEALQLITDSKYIKPNFVLFWDKDVKLAKLIESEGIKVFNSSNSIRVCDDKSLTYLYLRNTGIKMPKTVFSPLIYYHDIYKDEEYISFIEKEFKYPFVFKECYGSFGQQVYLINNKEELVSHIRKVDVWPFEIQEFIKSSFGRDVRIYVVGDKVLGGMKRLNKNGDFRANIEIGSVGEKYDLTKDFVDIALKAVRTLGLNFAGVDILFGENDEPVLCEVNSNAYFISFNKILGINVEDYILNYIIDNI